MRERRLRDTTGASVDETREAAPKRATIQQRCDKCNNILESEAGYARCTCGATDSLHTLREVRVRD